MYTLYRYTYGVSGPLKNALDWGSIIPSSHIPHAANTPNTNPNTNTNTYQNPPISKTASQIYQSPCIENYMHYNLQMNMKNLFENKNCGIIGSGRKIPATIHTTLNLRQICDQIGLNCVLDVPDITAIANAYQPVPFSYPLLFNINNGAVIDRNVS